MHLKKVDDDPDRFNAFCRTKPTQSCRTYHSLKMKKYSYAKIYLKLLLVVTVLVLLAGFGVAFLYFLEVTGNITKYRAIKNEPLVMDTKNLANELNAASEIVRSFTRRVQRFEFETKLSKQKIEISETARLRGRQIDKLESYIGVAREGAVELKAELLKGFQGAIDQLRASAQSALNQVEPTNSTVPPISKRGEIVAHAQAYHHLYDQESLAEIQLDELASVVSFLRNDVRAYNLSATAAATGTSAADELQALTKLIRDEADKYQREQSDLAASHSSDTQANQPPTSTPLTPSARAEYLSRFLDHLSVCETLANSKITRGWIVDGEFQKAENVISNFRSQQGERLAVLGSQILNGITLVGSTMLASITIALILLIIRDFLSALVDTAVNTGATVDTLEKMRRGES